MKKLRTTIVLFLFVIISTNLFAQNSSQLSIQGVLRNANGTAVENGQYDITFRLWDAPINGNQIWIEEKTQVDVEGGIYSVVLGDGDTSLDAPFTEQYFLGVSVEGGTELIPRAALTSSPYALSLIGNDNVFPNSGNVGVGSATPQNKLTIQRGNGILGLEAEEDANNTSTITTTSSGLQFEAGGIDKTHTFSNGNVEIENGDLQLNDGAFVFYDNANAPSTLASLDYDAVENQLNLKNEIGDIQLEGTQITLNPSNQPVEITKEGEALKLVGTDSTYISMTAQSGTNATAQFGFFENDTLKLETGGQDFMIDPKGGTTRIMNTLEVGEYGNNTYYHSYIRYFNSSSGSSLHSITSHNDASSIWAFNDITSTAFKALSDQRIKKDLKISNGFEDLNTLNQIEVTDYRHIDEVKNGPLFRKGLIAQQLKNIFPEAISLSTQYIPNVYSLSSEVKTEGNDFIITLEKPHGFQLNDKVKVIVEKGEKDVVIKNVIDEFSFTIASQKIKMDENVFVYGKEVDDFHTVDYDRVFTLAVSATQELARKVEALEKENAQLKKTNDKTNDILKTLNEKVTSLENIFEMTSKQ